MNNNFLQKFSRYAILISLPVLFWSLATFSKASAAEQEIQLSPGESRAITLKTSRTLSLDGRIVYTKPAGGNALLQISVNGSPVSGPLVNKGQSFRLQDGRTFNYKINDAWLLFYSADLSANNSTAGGQYQVMTDPGQAYHYTWDIRSLAGTAETMEVTLKNVSPTYPIIIIPMAGGAVKKTSDFPIAELGNCANEGACKQYCSISANYIACANYGADKGLVSKEDLARTKEYADVLKGDGPGACKDEASCKSYCDSTSHITECVAFAEKHNFVDKTQLEEAKKVAAALQSGAKLPGECKDKNSCDSYCKISSHIDECLAFAKAAGFISAEDAAQAEKVLPFIKSGETPGKCTTKGDCEKYCENTDNALECVAFAEKAGMMSAADAAIVKKTGGKGPGGCKSKDSCDAFCNAKENQQACFEFAKKYDIIPPEKLKEMEDGMGRLRSGLDQMPKEAAQCLKDALGADAMGEIQSGKFMPGPATGDLIKGCMEKMMPQMQEKIQQALGQATPETMTCLTDTLGADKLAAIKSGGAPAPEDGDVLQKCFGSMKTEGLKRVKEGLGKMPPEMRSCISDKLGEDTVKKIEAGGQTDIGPEVGSVFQNCAGANAGAMQQKLQEGMKGAPAEMQTCVQSKLGNIGEKMKSGELKGEGDVQALVQDCLKNFKPQGMPEGFNFPGGASGGAPPSAEDIQKMIPKGIPEQYKGMIPKGVPESMGIPGGNDGAAPSEEFLKKMQDQYKGAIPGGGLPATPSVKIPEGFGGGAPSAEDIQKMMPKGIPEQYKSMIPQGIPSGIPQ